MILKTIQRNHRKFEILHEVEALYDFASENASPDIQEVEIDFVYNHFHFVVNIAFTKFLTLNEYQFRLGGFNRCLGIVDSILIDTDNFEDFLNRMLEVL